MDQVLRFTLLGALFQDSINFVFSRISFFLKTRTYYQLSGMPGFQDYVYYLLWLFGMVGHTMIVWFSTYLYRWLV